MPVISIKRLLGDEDPSAGHPLRVAQILTRGMGLHAIEGDPEALRAFRASMERAAESLGNSMTDAAALVAAGAALRSLDEYNRSTEAYLESGGNDLRAMVKMLTEAITEFSSAGSDNIDRLKFIEARVASAHQSNDLTAIKKQLSNCLVEIRKEVERQRMAVADSVSRLKGDLERARTESVDPATGLPPRSKAVQYIVETAATDSQGFACCMVIDRLQNVNLTFGSDVGDQILRRFVNHVRTNLPAGDALFRWTGASLLAITHRGGGQQVREEFVRLMAQKLEFSFQTVTRSVLLPITARWSIFPFTASARELIEQIDAFTSPGPPLAA